MGAGNGVPKALLALVGTSRTHAPIRATPYLRRVQHAQALGAHAQQLSSERFNISRGAAWRKVGWCGGSAARQHISAPGPGLASKRTSPPAWRRPRQLPWSRAPRRMRRLREVAPSYCVVGRGAIVSRESSRRQRVIVSRECSRRQRVSQRNAVQNPSERRRYARGGRNSGIRARVVDPLQLANAAGVCHGRLRAERSGSKFSNPPPLATWS